MTARRSQSRQPGRHTRPSPESRRAAALALLLLEAGNVSANYTSATFREHGSREAGKLYLPGPEEIGTGPAIAARALRDAMRAMASMQSAEGRRHVADAMRALIAAVRAEPKPLTQDERREYPARPYWIEP
jgi:hypothetical protein